MSNNLANPVARPDPDLGIDMRSQIAFRLAANCFLKGSTGSQGAKFEKAYKKAFICHAQNAYNLTRG